MAHFGVKKSDIEPETAIFGKITHRNALVNLARPQARSKHKQARKFYRIACYAASKRPKKMNLYFYPVTIDRWTDFEQLFESKGGPHNCWCTVWRVNENKTTIPGKAGKKASMHNRVKKGIPIGLLAYIENKPIGWCSIAPRETYKKLGGDDTKEGVWSLVCFFIKRQFRNQGLTSRLIDAAIGYAKDNGAKYIEAYPVEPDSPSYRFMGFVPTFEKAGFQFVKSAGTRRKVMLFVLK